MDYTCTHALTHTHGPIAKLDYSVLLFLFLSPSGYPVGNHNASYLACLNTQTHTIPLALTAFTDLAFSLALISTLSESLLASSSNALNYCYI